MSALITLYVAAAIFTLLLVASLVGLWVESRAHGRSSAFAPESVPNEVELAFEMLERSAPHFAWGRMPSDLDYSISLPDPSGRSLEQVLNDTFPTLQALRTWFPADYQHALDVAQAHADHVDSMVEEIAQVVHDVIRSRLTTLDTESARDFFGMLIEDAQELPDSDLDISANRIMTAAVSPVTLLCSSGMDVRPMATSTMLEQLALRPAPPAQPLEPSQLMELADYALDSLLRHLPADPDELEEEQELTPEWEDEVARELYVMMIRITIDASPDDLRGMLAMAAAGERILKQVSIRWTVEADEVAYSLETLGDEAGAP